MRIRVSSGPLTYEFLVGDKAPAPNSRILFESVEDLARFLTDLCRDDAAKAQLTSLRRSLLSDSGDTTVRRHDHEQEYYRRFAQAFVRGGGIVVDLSPKVAARGGGGAADVVKPAPPKPAPPLRPAENKTPLTEFQVLEVSFITDHDKLKDYAKDWKNLGRRFPKPEWRPGVNSPISHTKYQPVTIQVKFRAGPPGGRTQYGVLAGKSEASWMSFASERLSIQAGERTLQLKCKAPIPPLVAKREHPIAWSLKLEEDGVVDGTTTGPHKIYCTYGTPMDDQASKRQEDGVTLKRMEAAVELAAEADTDVGHVLLERIMETCKRYTLAPSATIPSQYKHPHYKNFEGGAWAILQFRESGECQAIVRMLLGVLRQVGMPGEAEVQLVYAHPDAPRTPKVDPLEGRGLGAVALKKGTVWWEAALTDKPVVEGEVYPPGHTPMGGGKLSPGFNSYEAVLKYTDKRDDGSPDTRYYAGGAGKKDSIEETLVTCFRQLVWIERCPHPVYKSGYKVQKIVETYGEGR
jgi:hypothetical protein